MLEIDLGEKLKLGNDIFLFQIEDLDKYWAFNTKSGKYYTLNKTSYFVLEQLNNVKSVDELLTDFLDKYNVGVKAGTSDFNRLLSNLIKLNIIYRSNSDVDES